jgi:predicted deacylase
MNEYTVIPTQYQSYEEYIWTLLTEADRRHIPVDIIGHEISERTGISYPLYRLVINPQAQWNICIIAGVHGNEIAGPLSIVHMISELEHELPRNYRYIIYPVVNPTGYDLRRRYDDDYRDLNAVYKDTLTSKNYNEVQVLYQDFQKFLPFEAVITLHEDSDLDKFYMYGLGRQNLGLYHEVCRMAATLCPVWSSADIYGKQSDEMGLILSDARDHAFDAYLYSCGAASIACTLETPGKLAIDFRIHLMEKAIFSLLSQIESLEFPKLA